MVISKWTKVYSEDEAGNRVDLFYPFKYTPFIEGWARIAIIGEKEVPLSLVGATYNLDGNMIYRGYVFDKLIKSIAKDPNGDYSLKDAIENGMELVFNSRSLSSKVSIYEVLLKADIKLKDLGINIEELEYKIEGKYV